MMYFKFTRHLILQYRGHRIWFSAGCWRCEKAEARRLGMLITLIDGLANPEADF